MLTSWLPPPAASGAAGAAAAGCSGAAVVVVCSSAFFSPPHAARTRASPATMDVTRIAALASENRKVADLVNPFTRTQVYCGTLRREEGAFRSHPPLG